MSVGGWGMLPLITPGEVMFSVHCHCSGHSRGRVGSCSVPNQQGWRGAESTSAGMGVEGVGSYLSVRVCFVFITFTCVFYLMLLTAL